MFTSGNKYLGKREWQIGKTHKQAPRQHVTPEYLVHVYNEDNLDLSACPEHSSLVTKRNCGALMKVAV
jgi:hypothetical protein